jgi:hypothetical protein
MHAVVIDMMGGDFCVAILDDERWQQITEFWEQPNWDSAKAHELVLHFARDEARLAPDEIDVNLPPFKGKCIKEYFCQEFVIESIPGHLIQNILFIRAT